MGPAMSIGSSYNSGGMEAHIDLNFSITAVIYCYKDIGIGQLVDSFLFKIAT